MSRELPRLDIRRCGFVCVTNVVSRRNQIQFKCAALLHPHRSSSRPASSHNIDDLMQTSWYSSLSVAVFHSSGISSCFARVSGWCKMLITQLPEAPPSKPSGWWHITIVIASSSASLPCGCHSLGHVQLMPHRLSISWQTLLLLLRSGPRTWGLFKKGVEIVDLLQIQHQEEICVYGSGFRLWEIPSEWTHETCTLLIHWIPRGKEGFALVRMLDISVQGISGSSIV